MTRLLSVRDAELEISSTTCLVSIKCRCHPATKTGDQHSDRVCRVAERAGCEFVGLQPDRTDPLSGQRPPVEDEQRLVALLRLRCPIRDQQRADRRLDTQLFTTARSNFFFSESKS